MKQCELVFVGTELKLTTHKTPQNLVAVQDQQVGADGEAEFEHDDGPEFDIRDYIDFDFESWCPRWCPGDCPCFADPDVADYTLEEAEDIFGLCTHQYESSYTPRRMTEQMRQCVLKRCIEYDHLHPRELKLMVTSRSLHDPFPSGVTLKIYYLHQLHEADKSFTFRLMDLPAEVRLLIFTEILKGPDDRYHNHMFGFPQILRTSRQIHKEALGIIEDTNTFECAFWANDNGQDAVIHQERFGYGAKNIWSLPMSIDHFPTFLKRIKKLSITIAVSEPMGSGIVLMNHCMLALASFLMEGHRLNKLIITIGSQFQVLDNTANDILKPEAILYPLSRLRNISEVVVKGDLVPVETAASVVAVMQGSGPISNTIRDFEIIYREAWLLFQLQREMGLFGRDGGFKDHDNIPLLALLDCLDYEILGGCIDSPEREEWLRKTLEALNVATVNARSFSQLESTVVSSAPVVQLHGSNRSTEHSSSL